MVGESGEEMMTDEEKMQIRANEFEKESSSSQENQKFLTQKEYIKHLETLNDELTQAWEQGDRVRAVKIAIKCTKMLGKNSVPIFYPSMFVLGSKKFQFLRQNDNSFHKLMFLCKNNSCGSS